MNYYLVQFSFLHQPQGANEPTMVNSMALVKAESFEEAKKKINTLRKDNNADEIPDENFLNATIE